MREIVIGVGKMLTRNTYMLLPHLVWPWTGLRLGCGVGRHNGLKEKHFIYNISPSYCFALGLVGPVGIRCAKYNPTPAGGW